MRIGIVGLGLLGGSLARDLLGGGHSVIGFDRSPRARRVASRAGVVVPPGREGYRALATCDVCVIAVPVSDAVAVLRAASEALARVPLITDVGSTKRTIVRGAERLGLGSRFVGAHPMAGGTDDGWPAGRTGLFTGAVVYLCPAPGASRTAVSRARSFWRAVGGKPVETDAGAHDRFVAAASHLPALVASALGRTLARRGISRASLGSGGRDTTRLAAGSTDVWVAIAADNAAALGPLLASYEREIAAVRRRVESGRRAALRAWLGVASRWGRER